MPNSTDTPTQNSDHIAAFFNVGGSSLLWACKSIKIAPTLNTTKTATVSSGKPKCPTISCPFRFDAAVCGIVEVQAAF